MEMVRGEKGGVYIPLSSVTIVKSKKLERLNIELCACFHSFISSVSLSPALAPSSLHSGAEPLPPSRLCLQLKL